MVIKEIFIIVNNYGKVLTVTIVKTLQKILAFWQKQNISNKGARKQIRSIRQGDGGIDPPPHP